MFEACCLIFRSNFGSVSKFNNANVQTRLYRTPLSNPSKVVIGFVANLNAGKTAPSAGKGQVTFVSQVLENLKAKILVHVQVIPIMKWQLCYFNDNEAVWFSGKSTE